MADNRGDIEVNSLLGIVLLLVVAWLALEVVGEVFEVAALGLGPLSPLLGVVIVAVIVLWLLDYV
jgi:purine-cytosine permease-like protein